ncbi:MAG: type II toxin-antitoxin system RelE/ParE family toxin [Boseongicola sp.]|nr:type II toxin-antitoxin system RelE/ParE family toxin [Boseongicola sp.]
MIRNFRSRKLRRFPERSDARRIHPEHRARVRDILVRLNASASLDDMDLPGFRLHRLKGEHAGHWVVTVSANWSVIFRSKDGHAADVGCLDDHQGGNAYADARSAPSWRLHPAPVP